MHLRACAQDLFLYLFLVHTLTLSKWIMQVPDALMPSLSSGLATVKPGVSRSTKKVVMPRYPYLIKSIILTDFVHSFEYVRIYSPWKDLRWQKLRKPLLCRSLKSTSWSH